LLAQKRIVYICTNAMFMRKKMREYLCTALAKAKPSTRAALDQQLQILVSEELVSPKDAALIRNPTAAARTSVIAPNQWMYWNVHLDGLERTHDLIVEREGVFKECILAIRMAKILGYQVATNSTIYKETDMNEIEAMFRYLSSLGVDGHTISPGYEYDAAKKDMIQRLNLAPENFFLTRKMTIEKFSRAEEWGQRFPFFGTPIYLEFLAGKRDLTCSAWAIPTRNVRGWKGPCYLMTDGHFSSYAELLEKVPWENYGVVDGVAKDIRCENCMVHCGYEPSAMLGKNGRAGDTWKNIKFNFSPRPRPSPDGRDVLAHNGVSAGRGHLSEKKQNAAVPAN
jgi:hopanoid biosynthesis associated radical SAM protein HpnH